MDGYCRDGPTPDFSKPCKHDWQCGTGQHTYCSRFSTVRVAPASLMFSAQDWMIPRNVTVTVLKDDVAEPALHRTQVLHSVRSSPDPAYSALQPRALELVLSDERRPALVMSEPELSLREGAPA